MNSGEIQYIADTLIIEEYLNTDLSLTKEAGFFDSTLSTVASAIKNYVSELIDTSSPSAFIKSVLKLLEPSIFFRIHPLLGTLSVIGQMFGYSVTDILSSIVSSITPKILSGQQVTADDVNQAGKAMVSEASLSLMYDYITEIKKEAQYRSSGPFSERGSGAFFKPSKGTPLLYKMFGFLGKRKGKGLLTGFIVWFVKTILASAGLLAVGHAAKSILFNDKSDKKEDVAKVTPDKSEKPESANYEKPSYLPMSDRELTMPSSGSGQQWHVNDDETAWVVPLYGGIANTLLDWAAEIYPDFNGYEGIISSLPSFHKIVSLLEKSYDSSKPNYLVVPPGFNRRIDIVNTFAADAQDKINQIHPEEV